MLPSKSVSNKFVAHNVAMSVIASIFSIDINTMCTNEPFTMTMITRILVIIPITQRTDEGSITAVSENISEPLNP